MVAEVTDDVLVKVYPRASHCWPRGSRDGSSAQELDNLRSDPKIFSSRFFVIAVLWGINRQIYFPRDLHVIGQLYDSLRRLFQIKISTITAEIVNQGCSQFIQS